MEEYEYLENLNSEELAKIIDQMLDFEETTKALMILEEKDSQKALELGKDIMMMNGGDFQTFLACNRIQFSGPQTSHIML